MPCKIKNQANEALKINHINNNNLRGVVDPKGQATHPSLCK